MIRACGWENVQCMFDVHNAGPGLLFLAKLGKGKLDRARLAVTHFKVFSACFDPHGDNTSHLFGAKVPRTLMGISSPVVVTERRVVEFLLAKAVSRFNQAGASDKGTAGKSLRLGLLCAGEAFGAPFSRELMTSARVVSASLGMGTPSAPAEPAMSLAVALLIEDLALGGYWTLARTTAPPPGIAQWLANPCVVERARDLVMIMHSSLRGRSADRLQVVEYRPAPAGLDGTGVVVMSSVDKGRTVAVMKKREHWFLGRGLSPGVELWIADWAKRRKGTPSIVCGFRVIDGTNADVSMFAACSMSTAGATPKCITRSIREIALLSPVGQSIESSRRLLLSARSLRHLHSSLSSALAIEDVRPASSSGNWKGSTANPSMMPVRYAGAEMALLMQARTRLRVFAAVKSFVGQQAWPLAVPAQRDTPPSFAFLVSSPQSDPQLLGGDLLGPGQSPAAARKRVRSGPVLSPAAASKRGRPGPIARMAAVRAQAPPVKPAAIVSATGKRVRTESRALRESREA